MGLTAEVHRLWSASNVRVKRLIGLSGFVRCFSSVLFSCHLVDGHQSHALYCQKEKQRHALDTQLIQIVQSFLEYFTFYTSARDGVSLRKTLPPQSFVHSTCSSIPSGFHRLIPCMRCQPAQVSKNLAFKLSQCFQMHLQLLADLNPLSGREGLGPVKSLTSAFRIPKGTPASLVTSQLGARGVVGELTSRWGRRQHGR